MLDSLSRYFDAVVMLTWSNWKTEPRSNRYHYASRFARSIPVYFVQPDSVDGKVSLEVVENNITLVHVSSNYGAEQADSLIGILSGLGVRRPLNWIYNPQFEHYIRRSSGIVNIFHATEDYFGNTKNWAMADISIRDNVRRVLERVDILVGVSQGSLIAIFRSGAIGASIFCLRTVATQVSGAIRARRITSCRRMAPGWRSTRAGSTSGSISTS